MVKATVLNATTQSLGEHIAKATSTTPGQTEVSFRPWEADGMKTGIWEVTPGTFTSDRPGYHEVCQILSGTATVTEPDGRSYDLGPGSLFVTPEGWEGTWTVHTTLRKVWVSQALATAASSVQPS